MAIILHKSRKYITILDLAFALKVSGWDITLVNEATKEISPSKVLDQVGTVIPRTIETLATDPLSKYPIHFSKLDIKDRFWKMVCAVEK